MMDDPVRHEEVSFLPDSGDGFPIVLNRTDEVHGTVEVARTRRKYRNMLRHTLTEWQAAALLVEAFERIADLETEVKNLRKFLHFIARHGQK